MPRIVISTRDQYEAALEVIAAFEGAAAGSKEAYLREALQRAVDVWWNARRRQAH